jgi:hypothetical protein
MISILFALLPLGVFWWMTRKRKAAILAGVFLLFSLMTRVVALLYVDLAGPLYSDQLETFIGGGPSMPLFAGSVLAFLMPLAFFFRRTAMVKKLSVSRPRTLYNPAHVLNAVFAVLVIFVVGAYLDMLFRGSIPLLTGMDRLEYNKDYAGPLHDILNDNGFLLAFMLGLTFAYPRVHGRDFKTGPLVLYIMIMVYFALTGNRFSAFYAFTSFFVIPLATLPLLASTGQLKPPPRKRSDLIRFAISPLARYLAAFAGALFLVTLLINSVVNVRAYDDPANLFFQRILVQPIELWWASWSELQKYTDTSFTTAWYELFINPLDASRNTSVRLLMINSLGYERAAELAEFGTQFAGGYPEIFFELLGVWRALPVALVFGIVSVLLLRLVVVSAALGRIGTSVFAIYVFYGFTLLYIGGMLNFLIVWTYWVKCAILVVVYLIERQHVGPTRTRRARVAIPTSSGPLPLAPA